VKESAGSSGDLLKILGDESGMSEGRKFADGVWGKIPDRRSGDEDLRSWQLGG
jgi:hypothetical protein